MLSSTFSPDQNNSVNFYLYIHKILIRRWNFQFRLDYLNHCAWKQKINFSDQQQAEVFLEYEYDYDCSNRTRTCTLKKLPPVVGSWNFFSVSRRNDWDNPGATGNITSWLKSYVCRDKSSLNYSDQVKRWKTTLAYFLGKYDYDWSNRNRTFPKKHCIKG